jgi:hypothetical protein
LAFGFVFVLKGFKESLLIGVESCGEGLYNIELQRVTINDGYNSFSADRKGSS